MPLKNIVNSNLSDRVIDKLREAILSGEIAPGERLVERDLAEKLGVSHIPVREALAILKEERLVEHRPRRGARVAVLSDRDLAEISSLRVALEQLVAVRVQERWTAEAERKLVKIVADMTHAAEEGAVLRMFHFDRDFHQALWEMSEHSLLVDMTSKLRGRINRFLLDANSALETETLKEHAQSHQGIIDALAGDDPWHLRRVVTEHIEVAAHRISSRRQLNPSQETSTARDPKPV